METPLGFRGTASVGEDIGEEHGGECGRKYRAALRGGLAGF
jgi:hypothetical protein